MDLKVIPLQLSIYNIMENDLLDYDYGSVILSEEVYKKINSNSNLSQLDKEKVYLFWGYLNDSILRQESKIDDIQNKLQEEKNKNEPDKWLVKRLELILEIFLVGDVIRIQTKILRSIVIGTNNSRRFLKDHSDIFTVYDDYLEKSISKGYSIKNEYKLSKDGCYVEYKFQEYRSITRLMKIKDFIDSSKISVPNKYRFMEEFKNLFYIDKDELNGGETLIKKKKFYFRNFRLFHDFTSLKKEYRRYLAVDGFDENLMYLDIKNSQPFCLIEHLRSYDYSFILQHDEFVKFINLVKEGKLYDHFSDLSGVFRKKVKIIIFDSIMFSRNTRFYLLKQDEDKLEIDDEMRLKVIKALKAEYPIVYRFILDFKKNIDHDNSLWRKLQKMESDFFLEEFCLSLDGKVKPFITIHDAIFFLESDLKIIETQFKISSDKFFGLEKTPSYDIKYVKEELNG